MFLAIVVPKSVLSATSVCRPFATWGLSWDTALKYYWLKEHKKMWLCQFLGFKILTTYYFASWHVRLAGVYRVLQRTWRGEHQRQFCDYLRIVRWVGRLWISTIYRDKDPPGVSWLSLCTLVSCICIQINLTFSFVLKCIYLYTLKIQCSTVYSSNQ